MNATEDDTPARPGAGWRHLPGASAVIAAASVGGSVLASACCILPLVLFSLGIGGAWVSTLTALAAYKPVFVVVAGALITAGFVSMRRQRLSCDTDGYCASTTAHRVTLAALWLSVLLLTVVILWPYLLPILMGE